MSRWNSIHSIVPSPNAFEFYEMRVSWNGKHFTLQIIWRKLSLNSPTGQENKLNFCPTHSRINGKHAACTWFRWGGFWVGLPHCCNDLAAASASWIWGRWGFRRNRWLLRSQWTGLLGIWQQTSCKKKNGEKKNEILVHAHLWLLWFCIQLLCFINYVSYLRILSKPND